MATVLLHIDETDNGKNIIITDVTQNFADTANTGVTHVVISITDPDAVVHDLIDEDITQPAAQSDLTWTIPATDLGYTETYPDGFFTIDVEYTTSPASDPVSAEVLLDWEMKYYDFQLVKDLPWKLENTQFAYNKDIENSMVFNVLKRACQYSANVGQKTKANDILDLIENFKLQI